MRALECPETLGELHVHLALKMLVTERYMNHQITMIQRASMWRALEGVVSASARKGCA